MQNLLYMQSKTNFRLGFKIMNITRSQLKEIIREEFKVLNEKTIKTKGGLKMELIRKGGYELIRIYGHKGYVEVYGRKEIPNSPTNTQTKPKANIALEPSSNSVPSSATSEKTEKRSTKAIKESNSRFKQSGQKSDFITLRTLQLKNR